MMSLPFSGPMLFLGDVSLCGGLCQERVSVRRESLSGDPPYGGQAGGLHPTGMLSICFCHCSL